MHKVRDKEKMLQFGKNLKRIRKEVGVTQEELAYKSGLALSQIGRIETGRLNTSICTVYRIAEALNVSAGRLF